MKTANKILTVLMVFIFLFGSTPFVPLGTMNSIAEMSTAITNDATDVSANGATLNGTLGVSGENADVAFEYGTSSDYGSTVPADKQPTAEGSELAVSAAIRGLAPNTTYVYRVLCTDSAGTTAGSDVYFTTSTQAPAAITREASEITESGATLNGTINANNAATSVSFRYGLTDAYDAIVAAFQNPVTGVQDTPASANISGLLSNTTYHYQVIAENSAGLSCGEDMTFTTCASLTSSEEQEGTLEKVVMMLGAPLSTSLTAPVARAATYINATGFAANWDPELAAMGYRIDVSETSDFSSFVTGWNHFNAGPFPGCSINGLTPDKTYYYRVLAYDAATANSEYSNIIEVKTLLPGAPTVATNWATGIDTTRAILNGIVNPNNFSTVVSFEYGTDMSYGNTATADQSPLTGSVDIPVTATISGLKANTPYYYRVVGHNTSGTVYGYDSFFTTALAPEYTVKADGTIQLNRIYNASGDVVIPGEIDGFRVTSIGGTNGNIFAGNYEDYMVASVTIPAGITSIDAHAFDRCRALGSIAIPSGFNLIGDYAFSGCNNLISVGLPNTLKTIGKGAFNQCYGLNVITIPDGVTSIGDTAFNSCIQLQSISIPNGITTIPDGCFSGCENLTSCLIPVSVQTIGNSAFSHSGLTSISLPGCVTIGYNSFQGCQSLLNVFDTDRLKGIGSYAFQDCVNLKSIRLPNSMDYLYSYAFSGCKSLTSIYVSCDFISNYAFSGCTSLTDVQLGNTKEIGGWAFYNCDSLRSITIPGTVGRIWGWAFMSCSSLESAYFLMGYPNCTFICFSQAFGFPASNFKAYYIDYLDGGKWKEFGPFVGGDRYEFDPGVFYSINTSDPAGGKITVDKSSAIKDEEVSVSVTPPPGMLIKPGSLKYSVGANDTVINNNSFYMPESNVTISAEFERGTNYFVAEYFPNNSFDGQPRLSQEEDYIYHNWGYSSPSPDDGIPSNNFSVRWQGYFDFNEADYMFYADADDAIKVYIDDKVIIDQPTNNNQQCVPKRVAMKAGCHAVKVEYREDTGNAMVQLTWDKALSYKLKIGEDNNSFANLLPDFFYDADTVNYPWIGKWEHRYVYVLSDKYYDKLVDGQNPVFRSIVMLKMLQNWEGACYGISAAMALSKVNDIAINRFDSSATNFYSLDKPKDNHDVRDLIHYYQISTMLPQDDAVVSATNSKWSNPADELPKVLKVIVDKAQAIESGGEPFLITTFWDTKAGVLGHTFVCNGCEITPGGNYKIEIVDPNANGFYTNFYISADCKSFEYYTSDLVHVTNCNWEKVEYTPLESFDSINIDRSFNKPTPFWTGTDIYFDSGKIVAIADDNGKTFTWSEQGATGDLIPAAIDFIAAATEDNINSSQIKVSFANKGYYKVTATDGNIDVSALDDGYFANVQASGVTDVEFILGSRININGSNSTFTVSMSNPFGDGLMMISGSNGNNASIEQSPEGIIVRSGSNIDNLQIQIIPTPNTPGTPITVSSGKKDLLIKDKPNDESGEIQVFVSEKNDGVYNKLIIPGNGTAPSTNPGTTVNSGSDEYTPGSNTYSPPATTVASQPVLTEIEPAAPAAKIEYTAIFTLNKTTYYINGAANEMDTVPFVQGERILIPQKYLGIALGVPDDETHIKWDGATKTAILITADGKEAKCTIGSMILTFNGKEIQMDVQPVVQDGHIFLPARFLTEAMGGTVNWNGDARTVTVRIAY